MRSLVHSLNMFRACFGWSLLELLIALALVAIVASLAAPPIYATWQLQSLYDERQRLAQQIRFARITSIQANAKVSICWSSACGASIGFLTYLDKNNDSYWQHAELVLSQWQIRKGVFFHFNRDSQISFNSAGNTAQSGTMVLCSPSSSSAVVNSEKLGHALVLSSSGRLREAKAPCP
ncbi:GspH/FimT family protein [Candidatus Njordibacter sp. Uisw_056]|uniref:GspH/FimT family protein n=1 Tax=Candidatus Njordibacter sp. Uisw_056 TaxID=3230973 RepID=UPI003D494FB4